MKRPADRSPQEGVLLEVRRRRASQAHAPAHSSPRSGTNPEWHGGTFSRARTYETRMLRTRHPPPWFLVVSSLLSNGCQRPSEPPRSAPAASPQPAVPTPPTVGPDAPSGLSLTSFGGQAFRIVTRAGKVIWLDPWLRNPRNPTGEEDLAKVARADLIILTSCFNHGAYEDAVEILRKTTARLIAPTQAYSDDCEPMWNRRTAGWFPLFGERLVPLSGPETSFLDGDVSFFYEPYFAHEGFTQIALSFADGPTLYAAGEGLFHTEGSRDAADPYGVTPLRFPAPGPVVMLANVGTRPPFDPPHIARVAKTMRATVVVPWMDIPRIASSREEDRVAIVRELSAALPGVRLQPMELHQSQRF